MSRTSGDGNDRLHHAVKARRRVNLRMVALAACLLCDASFAASWTAHVDEREGLPVFAKGGASALSSSFAFWGRNWAWAGIETKFRVAAPYAYSIAGKNQALDFDLAARVRKSSNRELAWEFDFNALSRTADAIGGGIVFQFDLATFAAELGEPQLLAGNRGWAWGRVGGAAGGGGHPGGGWGGGGGNPDRDAF
jgi:hypothetical protein